LPEISRNTGKTGGILRKNWLKKPVYRRSGITDKALAARQTPEEVIRALVVFELTQSV
jgi:hypothetical protein